MKKINFHAIVSEFKKSIMGAVAISLIVALLIPAVEPAIGFAATTEDRQFTITQNITGDVSFVTAPTNITMSPDLGGISGGTSNGQTQVVVRTNNTTGYTMTITASSSNGMEGNATAGTIPALVTATPGLPDYAFSSGTIGANKAYFGYTVSASTTADLNISFKDNGSVCGGAGTLDTTGFDCWLAATTTAKIIAGTTGVTDGSTTTLKFRVVINANPSPAIPEDVYVATTTLTVTAN